MRFTAFVLLSTAETLACFAFSFAFNNQSNHANDIPPSVRRSGHPPSFLSKPPSASALHSYSFFPKSASYSSSFSSLSTSTPSDILLDVSQLKHTKIELWLDLRETSVSPQTALGQISRHEDMWQSFNDMGTDMDSGRSSLKVDKVLTKQQTNVRGMAHDIRRKYEREIGMMILDEHDYSIHELSDSGILLPCGRVINVEIGNGRNGITKLNADPMPVLEPVSRGDWVVLDVVHEDNHAYSNCGSIDAISSLVEVVSDGVGAFGVLEGDCGRGSTSTSYVNDDGHYGAQVHVPAPLNVSGGIGLSCPTQSSLLEMSTLLSSLNKQRKKYKMTESGLITQQYQYEHQPESSSSSSHAEKSDNYMYDDSDTGTGTAYAIVIPFEEELWKTSSFFLLQ